MKGKRKVDGVKYKYTDKFKLEVCKMAEKIGSNVEAGLCFGIGESTVRRWRKELKATNNNNSDGAKSLSKEELLSKTKKKKIVNQRFPFMEKSSKYTGEYKLKVCELADKVGPLRAARQYGIRESVVRLWRRKRAIGQSKVKAIIVQSSYLSRVKSVEEFCSFCGSPELLIIPIVCTSVIDPPSSQEVVKGQQNISDGTNSKFYNNYNQRFHEWIKACAKTMCSLFELPCAEFLPILTDKNTKYCRNCFTYLQDLHFTQEQIGQLQERLRWTKSKIKDVLIESCKNDNQVRETSGANGRFIQNDRLAKNILNHLPELVNEEIEANTPPTSVRNSDVESGESCRLNTELIRSEEVSPRTEKEDRDNMEVHSENSGATITISKDVQPDRFESSQSGDVREANTVLSENKESGSDFNNQPETESVDINSESDIEEEFNEDSQNIDQDIGEGEFEEESQDLREEEFEESQDVEDEQFEEEFHDADQNMGEEEFEEDSQNRHVGMGEEEFENESQISYPDVETTRKDSPLTGKAQSLLEKIRSSESLFSGSEQNESSVKRKSSKHKLKKSKRKRESDSDAAEVAEIQCSHISECQEKFQSEVEMQEHVVALHSPESYICTECGAAFKKNSKLIKHSLRKHPNDKPFLCPVEGCGLRFALSYNMKTHLRTHTGEGR